MSEPRDHTGPQNVYRRISPKQWESGGPEAFLEGEGQGLSLFRAEEQTPRGVMEHAIASARSKLQSSDPKVRRLGERQLARYGETVQEWVENGWHVVELPVAAFTERGYSFGPTEPDGPVEAFGDHDTYALEFADIAKDVPRDDFQQ